MDKDKDRDTEKQETEKMQDTLWMYKGQRRWQGQRKAINRDNIKHLKETETEMRNV